MHLSAFLMVGFFPTDVVGGAMNEPHTLQSPFDRFMGSRGCGHFQPFVSPFPHEVRWLDQHICALSISI